MNSLQDRLVTLAFVISETVWLYAVYASIGLLVGLGRSPISWAVCLAMYSSSLYLSRGIGPVSYTHLTLPTILLV